MARKLVKFLKGYSRYNKGETAGFDEAKAKALEADKVAVIVGDVKEPVVAGMPALAFKGDGAATVAEREAAETRMAEMARALSDRDNELSEKEAALAAKEAELNAREGALTASDKGDAGAPPKQGAKT